MKNWRFFIPCSTKGLQQVCTAVTHSESLPPYNLRRPPKKFHTCWENFAHEEAHINWLTWEPDNSPFDSDSLPDRACSDRFAHVMFRAASHGADDDSGHNHAARSHRRQ